MNERPKILLVDDRPENLLALEGLLREDARTLRAESGKRALELLLEHEVALALLDVQMPELDGFQLAELMRGVERTRQIPIIFVTAGLHDQARVFKGYELGAVDFLVKPIEPRVLLGKVRVFLELDRQKAELARRVRELETALEERRAAQQALQVANTQLLEETRRKSEFLAVLSHELRNPLAPVRNSLYVLDHAAPGGEQARRAKAVIDRQVDQLARLVDDLLDVTRIARNKVVLQREPLDLREVARRVAEDQRSLFERSGIALEVRTGAGPILVEADGARLAQVIGNLLQNAVKFTGRGGTTWLEVEEDEGVGRAVLRVRDTGVGMKTETVARLFEPFMQADASLDRSKGGLGLGLALAKGMVELHGGEIHARSDGLGSGSEFVVRLPLVRVELADRERSAARSVPSRRVLVIEDNVDSADTLREALEFGAHAVEVAYDGPRGLHVAREFRPEIVLCDIGLPEMNGYEVARAFRADDALKDVRLVALTGYAMPEDLDRARAAGFDHHLTKPPSLDQLEALLANVDGPGAAAQGEAAGVGTGLAH